MEQTVKLVIVVGISVLILAFIIILITSALTKGKISILNVTDLLTLK